MTHVTCRLTANNRDQLRNPTVSNRVWATFTFVGLTCDQQTHSDMYTQTDTQIALQQQQYASRRARDAAY